MAMPSECGGEVMSTPRPISSKNYLGQPSRPKLRLLPGAALPSLEAIKAVMACRGTYELGALIPKGNITGRPIKYPGYLLIAFGMLARHYRSGSRAHSELGQEFIWSHLVKQAWANREAIGDELWSEPNKEAVSWPAWRYARDTFLTSDAALAQMGEILHRLAVADAQSIGLLIARGAGSRAHPDRTRVIYGDGTVIKPIYKPPTAIFVPAGPEDLDADEQGMVLRYPDPSTGELMRKPNKRYDPDGITHHGHTGPVHGTNMVSFYARGRSANQRIILGLDTVPAPGQEAATAVELAKRIAKVSGDGAMAIVYDGALRGVHIEELMSRTGMMVMNKVHASAYGVVDAKGKKVRTQLIDVYSHETKVGPCRHQVAVIDGAITELVTTDSGQVVPLHRLQRVQVKRSERSSGLFHFNISYRVPCSADPSGGFLIWISPHATKEGDNSRPDKMRFIPEGDPDFNYLYGIRSDSESANSLLKRNFIAERSPSLGRRRLMVDATCFSLLHNALTLHRHRNHL
jgi:hypothetical protein